MVCVQRLTPSRQHVARDVAFASMRRVSPHPRRRWLRTQVDARNMIFSTICLYWLFFHFFPRKFKETASAGGKIATSQVCIRVNTDGDAR